ncbi:MAG: hypothetical protein M5U10_13785 [Candidatus Methanoperedens sp.]|nr:hypothetical protein [Candidatus Methanoperedens nitroreducens]MDJ1422975.1 hypothetical protein [Candidatus Methanoperedens sp.]
MKYIPIILMFFFFASPGCLGSSKEITPSELMLNPGAYDGKKVCISGVVEDGSISGILIGKSGSFTGDYKNWTLTSVCGIYSTGRIDADSIDPILSILTEKDTYSSNESLKVHIDFISQENTQAQVKVSGIRNAFDRALIDETREASIRKGINGFDFEFTTPSCEECSTLTPGEYSINATVNTNGKTFETYRRITLKSEK